MMYECRIGNEIKLSSDASNQGVINNMMVYHEDTLPDGLFPECKGCEHGNREKFARFNEDDIYSGMGMFKLCVLRKKSKSP